MSDRSSIVRFIVPLAIAILLVGAGCTSSGVTSPATTKTNASTPSKTAQNTTTSMTGQAIVRHINEHYRTLQSYRGTFRSTGTMSGNATEPVTKEIWARPGRGDQRIETLRPNRSAGNLVVSNESVSWRYNVVQNTATKRESRTGTTGSNSSSPTQFDGISRNATKRYHFSDEGNATVSGHATYKIRLTPKNGTKNARLVDNETLWLDTQYWFPIKRRIVLSAFNHTTVSTRTFTNITFDTKIPDRRFTFHPPNGTTIRTPSSRNTTRSTSNTTSARPKTQMYSSESAAQSHVDYTISKPSWRPPGFTIHRAYVVTYENASKAILVYTNSSGWRFRVTQLPRSAGRRLSGPTSGTHVTVNGHDGTYGKGPLSYLVRWNCSGFQHEIRARFEKQTTLEIANATACTG